MIETLATLVLAGIILAAVVARLLPRPKMPMHHEVFGLEPYRRHLLRCQTCAPFEGTFCEAGRLLRRSAVRRLADRLGE